MSDKREGFLPIWHGVWKTDLFASNERFDIRSAWFWLLMHAYYKPKSIVVHGDVIKAKRGQYFTSIRFLAQTFHWDVSTVRRYLNNTQKLGMIDISSTRNGTLITIRNYSKYNGSREDEQDDAYTEPHTEPYTQPHTKPHAEPPLVNKEYIENTGTKKEKEAPPRRGGWGVDYE